jgi:predicted dehydrogenase
MKPTYFSRQSTRRQFLAATTAGAALLPGLTKVAAAQRSANDQIQLGVIGIGPRCRTDLRGMLPHNNVRCVAIADVQESRRISGKAFVDDIQGNNACELHRDFRKLLERQDVDAVLIATGDRWHTDATILAAEAGKDVYSEKPCGITIDCCQRLARTIQRTNRVFQAGTQRRSVPNFQAAVQLAQSGALGKLHTLHASIYRPVLDNSWLPAEPTPDPEKCDWNLWLGPAPWRPYNQKYVQGRWRGQWDFDSGATLLDWGAHTLDLCQWANNADDTMPIKYVPGEEDITCHYANGVKVVLDFLKDPFGDRSPHYLTRLGTCPVRFVGEKGWVETGDAGEVVTEPESINPFKKEEGTNGLEVAAHSKDFFDAVRTRGRTRCNENVMRRSHIACHAAALSWVLGRTLQIDPKTETFIDDAEANLLRTRPSRNWQG